MIDGKAIFEVVSGQILLGRREEFMRLHHDKLCPMMQLVGIEPELLLFIDIGRYHRFIDIYRYPSWEEYKKRVDRLLNEIGNGTYYKEIAQCIDGGLTIELAHAFPHSFGVNQRG